MTNAPRVTSKKRERTWVSAERGSERYGTRGGRDGGIGRRCGLKIRCLKRRAGSSPAPGTKTNAPSSGGGVIGSDART